MEISIYAELILVTAILIISLDAVILIGSRNLSSSVFAGFSFLTGLWVASQTFFVTTLSQDLSNDLIRIQYMLGIVIAIGFYHFSVIYPNDNKPPRTSIYVSTLAIVIFGYLYFATNLLLVGSNYIGGIGAWGWTFGPWHWLFEISFCGLWIIALKNLFFTYKKSSGNQRANLKTMFWALFLGIIPPTVCNIILPSIEYYSLNWLGPICSSIWIFIIAYSIIKYRQMNVRAVVAEVLAIGMTVIFFINIFVNLSWGLWVDVVTFSIFLLLAIYLIRLVLREAKQRELLTTLNSTLSEKVAEQTAEVRKAYELEKHARRELEKLNETKDQFIMITQHHLRTPVTSIRWELEALLGGTYGSFSLEQRAALQDTNTAVGRLTRIVDDFLNITALKVGSQILNIETGNLLPLIEDVLHELKIDIENMHLKVVYPHDTASWPDLQIDASKMREVLLIILENAVKYNVDGGTIEIKNRLVDGADNVAGSSHHIFEMTIENSGMGLVVEDKEKLFSRHFYRSQRAQKANPIGMGIGLSVARAVVRAHHGTLEIESDGEGMGARVMIRLPNF